MTSFQALESIFKGFLTLYAYKKQGYELGASAACVVEDLNSDETTTRLRVWYRNDAVDSTEKIDPSSEKLLKGDSSPQDGPQVDIGNGTFIWKKWPVTERHVALHYAGDGSLESMTCSCALPQYMGILCRHACAVIVFTRLVPTESGTITRLLDLSWARRSTATVSLVSRQLNQLNDDILRRSASVDYATSPVMLADQAARGRAYKRQLDAAWNTLQDNLLTKGGPSRALVPQLAGYVAAQ
jgi:hypothetical protein